MPTLYAQIALNNNNSNLPTGIVTSLTIALTNVNAGELITVQVSTENSVTGPIVVNDNVNTGNYTSGTLANNTTAGLYTQMFYYVNSQAGSPTVSISWGANGTNAGAWAQSWTGVATTNPQDNTMTAISPITTGANSTTGAAITPAINGELVIGFGGWDHLGTTPTAGTNYIAFASTNFADIGAIPEYWIQTTATATNAPWTSGSVDYIDQMVAFKPYHSNWALTNSQEASGFATNPLSTPAFTNALTNPSIIVVGVLCGDSPIIVNVSDTAGNTYFDSGAGVIEASSNSSVQLFYALNTSTISSNIVSASYNSSEFNNICAAEFTGIGTYAATTTSDTFSRANVNPISTPWTTLSVVGIAGQIISDKLVPSSTSGSMYIYYTGVDWSPTQSAKITCEACNEYIGVLLRVTSGGTFYQCSWNGTLGGSGTWTIQPCVSGSFGSNIASGSVTLNVGDTLSAGCVGNTFSMYHNGTLLGSGQDVDSISSGSPGIFLGATTAVSDTACINFIGTGSIGTGSIPIDAVAGANISPGTNILTMTSETTSNAGDLIIAFTSPQGGTITQGTSPYGFYSLFAPFGVNITTFMEYCLQPAAGAIAPTMNNNVSTQYGYIWFGIIPGIFIPPPVIYALGHM